MDVDHPHSHALFTLYPTNDVAKAITQASNNSHLARKCRLDVDADLETGLQVGFQVPCSSQFTLATIGRDDADIIVEGEHFSRIQCSFEIDIDTYAILLHDRSRANTTQFFGASARRFQSGRSQRQVVINEHTNLEFGFGGSNCDYATFTIIWHRRDICVEDLVKNRVGNPRKNRTIEIPETDDPTRRVTRIHTPAAQANVRYTSERLIGRGQFGQVFRALNIDSGKFIAIKKLDIPGIEQEMFSRVKREVEIHASTCHLNVITFLGYQVTSQQLQIFLPLQEGNLETLRSKDFFQNRKHAVPFTHQMLQALDYLASKSIIHKDVKPENILFTTSTDGTKHYVLSDFGLSNLVCNSRTISGSPLYQAPEIDENSTHRQTSKADVWSLFVTIIDILDVANFRSKLLHMKVSKLAAIAEAVKSREVWELNDMAHEDPNLRACAGDVLDSFFRGEGRTTRRALVTLPASERANNVTPRTGGDGRKVTPTNRSPLAPTPAGIQKRRILERQNLHRNLFVVGNRQRTAFRRFT